MKFFVNKFVEQVVKKAGDVETAFILGSGLNCVLPEHEVLFEVKFEKLGIEFNKIQGHSRKLVFGVFPNGKKFVIVSRIHFYEKGNFHGMQTIFEILKKINVQTVVLTTASGGLSNKVETGDLMLITDHINATGANPLIAIENQWFVGLSNVFDVSLCNKVEEIAKESGINLKKGVHLQTQGASFETASEVRMFMKAGADTVSMSTATDAILARHHKMRVLGFAAVTNMGTGISKTELTHEEVLQGSQAAQKNLRIIFSKMFS